MSSNPPQLSIQTSSNSLEFNRNPAGAAKPLNYRPACLRHKSASSVQQLRLPPSPGSNSDVNWLGGNSPWSATTERESRYDSSAVKGTVLPRSAWKPDDEAITCAADCTTVFGVVNRKHHCRRCGQVYCATHSSRTTLLWPCGAEPSPRLSISTLDFPGLALASYFTPASSRPSTPSSSPPRNSPFAEGTPIVSRVCDSCYFLVPNNSSLITPPTSTHSSFSSPKPLPFRHQSRHSTPLASPAQSPHSGDIFTSRGNTRARHGSAHSVSTSSSEPVSTPPTSYAASSIEALTPHNVGRSRGVSPAGSIRIKAPLEERVEEEEEMSVEERDAKRLENELAFGSVSVEWSWQSWATF